MFFCIWRLMASTARSSVTFASFASSTPYLSASLALPSPALEAGAGCVEVEEDAAADDEVLADELALAMPPMEREASPVFGSAVWKRLTSSCMILRESSTVPPNSDWLAITGEISILGFPIVLPLTAAECRRNVIGDVASDRISKDLLKNRSHNAFLKFKVAT